MNDSHPNYVSDKPFTTVLGGRDHQAYFIDEVTQAARDYMGVEHSPGFSPEVKFWLDHLLAVV